MRFKILSLLAAMALVSACSTAPEDSADSSGSGEATTSSTADTSSSSSGSSVAPSTVDEVVAGSERDFLINVGDRIFFDFDRSDIRADAQSALAKQAAWLLQHPGVTIQVEGHCDERGTNEYNLALGDRRANTALDTLAGDGVDRDRVSSISYGEDAPVCTESDEACWQRNRRAHMTITGRR